MARETTGVNQTDFVLVAQSLRPSTAEFFKIF